MPDLPPVIASSFKLDWGACQARDGLPKGKRKSCIRKFLDLAMIENYRLTYEVRGYDQDIRGIGVTRVELKRTSLIRGLMLAADSWITSLLALFFFQIYQVGGVACDLAVLGHGFKGRAVTIRR